MKALEQALASFHVQRQAYYSGTFVGNHVHHALKVNIPQLLLTKFIYLHCAAIKHLLNSAHLLLQLLRDTARL